ncbi:uncharacterized protein BJ171DRAFT_528904 [Polychytrium aggregatum]|uniref:uncharacterized protein n=1 Tax=Polychytrium aggregatum TaxID=110093 RepID=UPI0022FF3903|nr:uncharacterized protein BJ171DRAFT_528904 [Polychytrium aggregatum]KAI9193323.1 hypothetical protein BJ171DRAFT_528904 [Polychytrium aggregatum]
MSPSHPSSFRSLSRASSLLVFALSIVPAAAEIKTLTSPGSCLALTNTSYHLPAPASNSTSITLSTCSNTCIVQGKAVLLISKPVCFCVDATDLTSFSAVNDAECSTLCDDQAQCGNTIFTRFSGYQVFTNVVNISIPSAPSSTSAAPRPVTTINVLPGSDSSKTVVPTWLIVGGSVAAVLFLFGVVYLIRHRSQQQKLHTLPRLEAGVRPKRTPAVDKVYLIDKYLPATTNMIYSVITPYEPPASRFDEIAIQPDQVVVLHKHFNDRWALATNITSGQVGYIPMNCLISDERWIRSNFPIPSREDSILHSNTHTQANRGPSRTASRSSSRAELVR